MKTRTAREYTDEIINGYCKCKDRIDMYGKVKNCWVCVERLFTELIKE
jgi:hypothetical protein